VGDVEIVGRQRVRREGACRGWKWAEAELESREGEGGGVVQNPERREELLAEYELEQFVVIN
jgi:hypothetical protein